MWKKWNKCNTDFSFIVLHIGLTYIMRRLISCKNEEKCQSENQVSANVKLFRRIYAETATETAGNTEKPVRLPDSRHLKIEVSHGLQTAVWSLPFAVCGMPFCVFKIRVKLDATHHGKSNKNKHGGCTEVNFLFQLSSYFQMKNTKLMCYVV